MRRLQLKVLNGWAQTRKGRKTDRAANKTLHVQASTMAPGIDFITAPASKYADKMQGSDPLACPREYGDFLGTSRPWPRVA